MKICVAGANGRMGRRILELAALDGDIDISGAFDTPESKGSTITLGASSDSPTTVTLAGDAAEALHDAEVLIDFTAPEASLKNVRTAVHAGVATVVGTTGLTSEDQMELLNLSAEAPIVFAPNMSVGVNLLFKLAGEVASVLGLDYNVEIVEMHHNQKKDSPSGTAVRLAERVAESLELKYDEHVVHGRHGMVGKRPRDEIGMHALRGGDVVGEHTVSFIGNGERVELTHKAHNRDNFARGALIAARFTLDARPGLYDMQDVLGLR